MDTCDKNRNKYALLRTLGNKPVFSISLALTDANVRHVFSKLHRVVPHIIQAVILTSRAKKVLQHS